MNPTDTPTPPGAAEGKTLAERIRAIEYDWGGDRQTWNRAMKAAAKLAEQEQPAPAEGDGQRLREIRERLEQAPKEPWNGVLYPSEAQFVAHVVRDVSWLLAALAEAKDKLDEFAAEAHELALAPVTCEVDDSPAMVLRKVCAALAAKGAEVERATRAAEAGARLRWHDYLPWQSAGGPDECSHGVAAGIPCEDCDVTTLAAYRAARKDDGAGEEKGNG